MIRRLSYCLVLMLLVLVSCTEKLEGPSGQYIKLVVYCDEAQVTRNGNNGTALGEEYYNEDLISTVDFFFYPGEDPDRDTDAAFHRRMGGSTPYNGSAVFMIDDLTSEIINNKLFPTLPREIRQVTVFAIANYPGILVPSDDDLSGTSLNELENKKVTSNFAAPADFRQESFMMSGTSVINLRGRTQILTASGSVNLSRYACKITVGVSVAENVTLGDGQVWNPMLESMAVYLVNGAKTVKLGGMDDEPEYFSYSKNQLPFATKDINTGVIIPKVDIVNGYYYTYPMYSYPIQWTYGADTGYEIEPYLKLIVPWARKDENGFPPTERQLYYKVMMPEDPREGFTRSFARNNWYHINIDVSILGSQTDDGAITVESSCVMVDWQEQAFQLKQAEVGKARYLSVEKEEYVLNNLNEVSINYTTSHPVIIKEKDSNNKEAIRVTRLYYGEKSVGSSTPCGGVVRKDTNGDIYKAGALYIDYDLAHRKALNGGEDWLYNTGTSIVFTHELNPRYEDEGFDYSPYTVTFTIAHEDRPDDVRYSKNIKLIQYPAIFIEAIRNSDNTFENTGLTFANKKIHASKYWGYVFVDGLQIVRSQVYKDSQGKWVVYPANDADITKYLDYFRSLYPDDAAVQKYTADDFHWRVVWYTGGSLDILKMNITMLPPATEGNSLVIGDPRTKEVNNLGEDWHVCPALYGDSPRALKYYYPAEGSDRTANMMAPSYCIASKCGGVEFDNISKKDAELRCASFQEDGFPAGRWRLPTRGEILFIAQLSANNAFTYLFSNNQIYWSANGAIKVNKGTVTSVSNGTALTRCVYDSWYWGDDQLPALDQNLADDDPNQPYPNRNTFVWGDQPR